MTDMGRVYDGSDGPSRAPRYHASNASASSREQRRGRSGPGTARRSGPAPAACRPGITAVRALASWPSSVSCRRLRCCTSFFSMSCVPASACCRARLRRAGQGGIDLGGGALQHAIPLLERGPEPLERLDHLGGQLRAHQPRLERAGRGEQIGQLDAELLQHPVHPGLHDHARPARQRALARNAEPLVDRRREGQVAQLARAAEVGHRGQQRALDHRPQQHVGREPRSARRRRSARCACEVEPLAAPPGHEARRRPAPAGRARADASSITSAAPSPTVTPEVRAVTPVRLGPAVEVVVERAGLRAARAPDAARRRAWRPDGCCRSTARRADRAARPWRRRSCRRPSPPVGSAARARRAVASRNSRGRQPGRERARGRARLPRPAAARYIGVSGASGGRGGSEAVASGAVGRDPGGRARLGEIVVVAGQPEHRHDRPVPAPLEHARRAPRRSAPCGWCRAGR